MNRLAYRWMKGTPTVPQPPSVLSLDFSASDRADEHELNDILWIAIKGTIPPTDVHSRFAEPF
jgi:hypothetical protein